MAGAFVTGSSMAVLNISWRICSPKDAKDWALGLANILTEGVPIAEGTFIIVLPLVSRAGETPAHGPLPHVGANTRYKHDTAFILVNSWPYSPDKRQHVLDMTPPL